MVIRDDLVSLRDFFKQGMQFSVVEEMVGSTYVICSVRNLLYDSHPFNFKFSVAILL